MSSNRGGDPVPVQDVIMDTIMLISKKQQIIVQHNDYLMRLGSRFIGAVRSGDFTGIVDALKDLNDGVRVLEEIREARSTEELEAFDVEPEHL